jgi:F-type H+-transporting ATPase subunit b
MDFSDPKTWIVVALLLFFVLLFFLRVPMQIWKSLGDTGNAVRTELDEAVRIRQEAQDLLNRLKAERIAAELRAKDLVAIAEEEARSLADEAKLKLAETIARREALALRKISQAEAEAAAYVKAAAVELAGDMAERLLQERVTGMKTDASIDAAIIDIDKRIA